MLSHFEYAILEELSLGKGLSQLQNVFNTFINELEDYLKLQPLYPNIIIKLRDTERLSIGENVSVLDLGVEKVVKNNTLIIEVFRNKFLPFILFREA